MGISVTGSTRDESPFVGSSFRNSASVWLLLVAFLVVVRLFILFIGAGLQNDSRAGLFDWPFIAIFGAAGLVGVWFSHKTGFPAALDPGVDNRQRFLYPAVVGVVVGLLLVGQELATGGIRLFLEQTGLPTFNAAFPGSLLFYSGGAIIVEVFYRLLPIPLILWLVSNVLLSGRGQASVFWALAILTSAIEPYTQELGLLTEGHTAIFVSHFVLGYAFNFSQAVFFRRAGFVAALMVRWAAYLIWHIGYGNLICNC